MSQTQPLSISLSLAQYLTTLSLAQSPKLEISQLRNLTVPAVMNIPMAQSSSRRQLTGEQVEVEGYGIVLINTDEAGTLIATNFRLLFLSEGTRNVIPLGTIPLATIEKFNKMHVGRKVRDKWIYWWNLNLGSSSVLMAKRAKQMKASVKLTSKMDRRVNWHSTPFETRLERALNRGAADAYSSSRTPHGL
ncbi:putative phosphoric monoester hydrolase [Rosa chinensis]|uniref:Putative phosphoric monoester hydrolase n=1 Tax=Rosa chinensis TaxID=74649 RepID=A0A2P6SQR5_ROSCH|nr:putative phosphoric monoester hydrolase [Rosa chinensis]